MCSCMTVSASDGSRFCTHEGSWANHTRGWPCSACPFASARSAISSASFQRKSPRAGWIQPILCEFSGVTTLNSSRDRSA